MRMTKFGIGAVVSVVLIVAASCGPAPADGCGSDADCKGTRICVASACVDGEPATPTPVPMKLTPLCATAETFLTTAYYIRLGMDVHNNGGPGAFRLEVRRQPCAPVAMAPFTKLGPYSVAADSTLKVREEVESPEGSCLGFIEINVQAQGTSGDAWVTVGDAVDPDDRANCRW